MNADQRYAERLATADAAEQLAARMDAAGAASLGDLFAIETTEAATADRGELDDILGGAA